MMDIKLSQQIELAAWDIFIDSLSQSILVQKITRIVLRFIENKQLILVCQAFLVVSLTLIFAWLAGFVLNVLLI